LLDPSRSPDEPREKQFCRRKPSLSEFIRRERIGSNKNLLFRSVALTLHSLINDFIVMNSLFAANIIHGRYDR